MISRYNQGIKNAPSDDRRFYYYVMMIIFKYDSLYIPYSSIIYLFFSRYNR